MTERRDCPYCPGTLHDLDCREYIKQCDGADCPATFVAVIPGG